MYVSVCIRICMYMYVYARTYVCMYVIMFKYMHIIWCCSGSLAPCTACESFIWISEFIRLMQRVQVIGLRAKTTRKTTHETFRIVEASRQLPNLVPASPVRYNGSSR